MNNTTGSVQIQRNNIEIYLQVVVLILLQVTTIVGNILVGLVIYRDYRLHRPGFYFIANLSVADLLVGCIYIPMYIDCTLKQDWRFSQTLCKFHGVIISTSFNASLVTLGLVSIDRLLAITKPLRYNTLMTTRRSVLFIVIGWFYSLFWACAPLVGWGNIKIDNTTNTCRPNFAAQGPSSKVYAMVMAFFSFLLPTVVMLYCYCRIFKVARNQIKLINKTSIARHESGSRTNKVNESKALKTVLLVLGAFALSWLPYTVVTSAKLVVKSIRIGPTAANAVLTITLLNGSINPFIYSLRDKRFKSGFRKIVCSCCKQFAGDIQDSYAASVGITQTQTSQRVQESQL